MGIFMGVLTFLCGTWQFLSCFLFPITGILFMVFFTIIIKSETEVKFFSVKKIIFPSGALLHVLSGRFI